MPLRGRQPQQLEVEAVLMSVLRNDTIGLCNCRPFCVDCNYQGQGYLTQCSCVFSRDGVEEVWMSLQALLRNDTIGLCNCRPF